MEYVALGRTDLLVSRTAFGAESLEELSEDEAAEVILAAYDGGVNFFDTSRLAPESEALLGKAVSRNRDSVVLATKTRLAPIQELRLSLAESLAALRTDHIDLYQIDQPSFVPKKGGADGIFDELENMRSSGKIRFIGLATDSLELAEEAATCGFYDSVQFPFSVLSSEKVQSLVAQCRAKGTGFIAMQPLCGGVVSNVPLALGFLNQFENVIPLWGARSKAELEQILYFAEHPPLVDEKFKAEADRQRAFFS